MENLTETKKIELEESTLRDIDTTRKWSMFLAILGFIAIGLVILIGLIAGIFLSAFSQGDSQLGTAETILVFAILFLLMAIYFFPLLYLYRFSKHAGNAVRTMDKDLMAQAFQYLRKYYVFIGILTIVALAFYVIALVVSGASLAFLRDLGTGV